MHSTRANPVMRNSNQGNTTAGVAVASCGMMTGMVTQIISDHHHCDWTDMYITMVDFQKTPWQGKEPWIFYLAEFTIGWEVWWNKVK